MRLLKRIAVGVVLIAVVVAAVGLHPLAVAVLVAVWSVLASREYTELVRKGGVGLARGLLPVISPVLPVALGVQYLLIPDALTTDLSPVLLVPLALAGVYAVFARAPRGTKLAFAAFGVLYLGLLPTHLVMLRLRCLYMPQGWLVTLIPLAATWVNDTAAYGFGRALGRHKLAPEISPNKTWEGFICGMLVTVGFSAAAVAHLLPGAGAATGALLGLVLSAAAQLGDLVESAFKREAGVKDSSAALSEHGGFLDRVDSLLFTIPVFYYFLLLVRA